MDCIVLVANSSSPILMDSQILSPSWWIYCRLLSMCIMRHIALSENKVTTKTKNCNLYMLIHAKPLCLLILKIINLNHNVLAQKIEFVKCNALNSSSGEISSQALELINALKFDKLTYPESSKIKSQWIDAFFKSISRQHDVTSIHSCLQSQKSSLLDEINPIISQMECKSVSCTIEVLQSFNIDIKQTSKLSFAKFIINKSLDEILRSHSLDFNSMVTLPPRLPYKKGKIKSFKLF